MSFGTYKHSSSGNNSNHNYRSWGSQSNEDTWNQRKRPRHFQDEDRRRGLGGPEPSRPFDYKHPLHSSMGHKPELRQRTAAAQPNDPSFAARSDDHSSPHYFHEKGHDDNVNNNIMCNPRQNQGGNRGREEGGIYRGGTFGARRRSQSPPTRGHNSSRVYDMDRGYPESGDPRGNEWSHKSSIGGNDAAGRERYASTGHYQESPTNRPATDRTFHRDALSLNSHQRNSRASYPERHGRELENSYRNGTNDHGDSYSGDRVSANDISRNDASRAMRGYPLQNGALRRPEEEDMEFSRHRRDEDMEFSRRRPDVDVELPPHRRHSEMEFPYRQHGDSEFSNRRDGNAEFPLRRLDDGVFPQRRPEVWAVPYGRPVNMDAPRHRPENRDRCPDSKPSRDAPRNGAYSAGYRPVSTGVFPEVDQQRFSTTRSTAEAYVSVDKKRGIDHRQEQSPPRKRINPIEPKGAPSPAMSSTMATQGRLESAATNLSTFSALHSVAKALPESVTPSMGGTAQKVESSNPYSMTGRANSEPQTVTSSPSGMKSKDGKSLSITGKVIAAAAPVLIKEKTISGIPMRWLKPASKPKIKAVISKEPTKPQDAEKAKSSDIVSNMVIPRQVKKNDCSAPTSPTCNRMVTDSEGGSTASTSLDLLAMVEDSKAQAQVPVAIVTTKETDSRTKASFAPKSAKCLAVDERGRKPTIESNSSQSDSDSSDTDEDEVRNWASVMFGLNITESKVDEEKKDGGNVAMQKAPLRLRLKLSPSKIAFLKAQRRELKEAEKAAKVVGGVDGDPAQSRIKLKERGRTKKNRKTYLEVMPEVTAEEREIDEELQRIERQDERRIREEAKPLTAAQIRAILGEDDFEGSSSSNWVRRSVRQPSLALLNSKPLKALVAGLKNNHPDMVVLKMKKYINDPDAPSCVIDAALEALEENSNCEALYIQVRIERHHL